MKKIFIIIILLYSTIFANNNYELKLYEKVLPSIFTKYPIKIFVDKKTKKILKDSDKFIIVDNCTKDVVLLIGKDFLNLSQVCKEKPIFSTSYRNFKNTQNSFGAFYWRKGRPQIRFKQNIINKYNLVLPNSFNKYVK